MTLLFHKSMSVPLSLFGSFELTSMGQTPACMGVDTGDTQTGLQPTLTEGQSACLNIFRRKTLCSCKCSLFLKNPETLEYPLFFYFTLFSRVCASGAVSLLLSCHWRHLQYSQPFLPFQRTFASSSRGEGKHNKEEGDGRRRVGGMNEKERGRRPMPWRVGVVAMESYRVFDCPLRVIFRSVLHFQKYMIQDCNNWFGGHFSSSLLILTCLTKKCSKV